MNPLLEEKKLPPLSKSEKEILEEAAHIMTKRLRMENALRLGIPLNTYLRTSLT